MSMRRRLLAAVAVALPLAASDAQVTYASRAAFNAAISGANTWDFTGPTGNPVIFLNSLGTDIAQVSSVGGDAAGIIINNTLCGSTGGSVDCFRPVRFDLLQPVTAFGYDNLDLNGSEDALIAVTFSGGASNLYTITTATPFTPVFFGITSNTAITRVDIWSADPGDQTQGLRANVIDNVTLGQLQAVPEPGTVTLVGIGMLGLLGGAARRRQRV
jgi:hypothetical protein